MLKERSFITFLFSVVLIIAGGFLLPKANSKKIKSQFFWAYKTHRKDKQDIIIAGDSRAYRGISPEAMQAILTDMRILNFGYSSGRLNKYMFKQVEKRLDLNNGKKIIVLAVSPNSLTNHPNENSHINSQLFLPKEEIYQRINFAPFLKFFDPVKPENIKKKKKKINYIEYYHPNGWVESMKIPEDTTEALKSYREWFTKTNVSPDLVHDLILQTQEWTDKGILVFAFRPPSSLAMENLEDSLGNFNQSLFIENFEKAGGLWIKTYSRNYHSYDGSHLHKDSAIKLSKLIARKIEFYLKEKEVLN